MLLPFISAAECAPDRPVRRWFALLFGGARGATSASPSGRSRMARVDPALSEVSTDRTPWVTGEVRARLADYLVAEARTDCEGLFTGRFLFAQVGRLGSVRSRLGQAAGDQALRKTVERLVDSVDPHLAVAHLGGGLVVVVEPHRWRSEPHLAHVVVAAVETPTWIRGEEVALTCRTTKVLVRGERIASVSDARGVIDRSELHACLTLAAGRGDTGPVIDLVAYDAEVDAVVAALDRKEIVAHYQPIVDVSTGAIVAAEALARWPEAPHGMDQPEDFLPLAAAGQREACLTDWMLDQVCRDLARLGTIDPAIWITLNLSVTDVHSPDIAERVMDALERHSVSRDRLVLELSERIVPTAVTCEAVAQLSRRGLRLAIDDYGSPWSCPRQLTALPIEIVKLDRSLITGSVADRAALHDAVSLARSLNMAVLVEGVELGEDLDRAENIGADYGQGFLWGQAATADELVDRVAAQDTLRLG